MKDRQGSLWTLPRLLPVVVALQVGLFWLAMRVWNAPAPHDVPSTPVATGAGRPDAAAPRVLSQLPPGGAPLTPHGQPPRWLPPLTDRTRTLLTSFQPLAEERGLQPADDEPLPGEPEPLELEGGALPEQAEPLSTCDGPELGSPSPGADDLNGAKECFGPSEPWHFPEASRPDTARLEPPEAALGAAVVDPEPEDVPPPADSAARRRARSAPDPA